MSPRPDWYDGPYPDEPVSYDVYQLHKMFDEFREKMYDDEIWREVLGGLKVNKTDAILGAACFFEFIQEGEVRSVRGDVVCVRTNS